MPYPLSPFLSEFDTKLLMKLGDKYDGSTVTTIQIEDFSKILKWLCECPKITSYRVNISKTDSGMVMALINEYIKENLLVDHYASSIKVYQHRVINDVIIVESQRTFNKINIYDKEIIVDVICAAALLRGAHIYAPGVLAMFSGTQKGDLVSVYADLSKKCKKGLLKPYNFHKVFIGNGVVKLARNELFCEQPTTEGVAIEMLETISNCPPLGDDFLPPGFALLQNLPSIICVEILDPQPNDRILDMCASPGNKTTHIASLMKNKGKLVAIDKTPSKVAQLRRNCESFNASIVEILQLDSTKLLLGPDKYFNEESFDRILLDAPCSALGKRPQLLNTISVLALRSFVPLQRKLFENAVALLKVGGTLVYSTCTITLAENEGIVAWALRTFPRLELIKSEPHFGGAGLEIPDLSLEDRSKMQRFGPDQEIDSVGFFVAKFIKKAQ